MQLRDDEFDAAAADFLRLKIEGRASARFVHRVEADESVGFGHARATGFHPVEDHREMAEHDIRLALPKPFFKGRTR
jgi:hypothetical protein